MEKKELRPNELKPSVIGNDKRLIQSLKTPQVCQRPIEDLKEVLRLIMLKIGIRAQNLPSEEEKAVLIHHIVDKYGNHTHEEIKLAFDLAITGNLDLEDKDIPAYGDFTCVYFSRIMTAYRSWAAKTYKAVVKPVIPDPIKENLNDKTMQDWWNDVSKRIRHKGLQYHFVSVQLYDWAISQGMVQNSGLKKKTFLQLAVEKIIEELSAKLKMEQSAVIKKELEDFIRMKNFTTVEAYYAERVTTVGKRLMVYEMMKNEKDEITGDMVGGEPQATV